MRIAILGAGGVVGRKLAEEWAARPGLEVLAVCRQSMIVQQFAECGIQAISAELGDPALAAALRNVTVVVNTIRPKGTIRQWRAVEDSIARMVAGLPKDVVFVHLSTVSVYSALYGDAAREAASPSARSAYARNKLWMETRLRRGDCSSGRRIVNVRLGHVWGPDQSWSRKFARLLAEGTLELPLDGQVASNAIHVRSLAHCLLPVCAGPPGWFSWDAVQRPQWSWRQVIDFHSEATGLPRARAADQRWSIDYKRRLKEQYTSGWIGRWAKETARWMLHLPWAYFHACPSASEGISRMLVALGAEQLEERLRLTGKPSNVTQAPRTEYWMVWDPAPGAGLDVTHEPGKDELLELRTALSRCKTAFPESESP